MMVDMEVNEEADNGMNKEVDMQNCKGDIKCFLSSSNSSLLIKINIFWVELFFLAF